MLPGGEPVALDNTTEVETPEHVRFRYRVIIHPGQGPARLAELYQDYAKTRSASNAAPQTVEAAPR